MNHTERERYGEFMVCSEAITCQALCARASLHLLESSLFNILLKPISRCWGPENSGLRYLLFSRHAVLLAKCTWFQYFKCHLNILKSLKAPFLS